MKKILLFFVVGMLLVGCGAAGADSSQSSIKVYTRDSASGTREAFMSIIGLETMSPLAAETTSNGDIAKQVGASASGIGYVSLTTDFGANKLLALSYEGVEANVETINSGEYKLARPFSFVSRASGDFDSAEKELLILALIDYMTLSTEGLQVILSSGGIVDVSKGVKWSELALKHPIVSSDNSGITLLTGGSTSVTKTLDAVVGSFIPLAGNFKYEPNHTGSSDGYKRTLGSEKSGANAIDLGFASREFKSEEDGSLALTSGVYCLDAVVVVVNEKNTHITDASKEFLNEVFSGSKTSW